MAAAFDYFVFGYGSLMIDGWENAFEGLRYPGAELPGYRRSLNKASTQNWGTTDRPCPTMGLDPAPGATCIGCAFAFRAGRADDVFAYLRQREGPSFSLDERSVHLPDGASVMAVTAVNDRAAESYIGRRSISERLALIPDARGPSGRCIDYVTGVHRMLVDWGVHEPELEAFVRGLEDARTTIE